MVTDYGMTSAVGAVKLGTTENETVLGLNATNRDFSEQVAATVDAEVRSLLDTAHREAWEILTRNRAVLDELAEELLTRETLLEKDLERIFADVVKQPERPCGAATRRCLPSRFPPPPLPPPTRIRSRPQWERLLEPPPVSHPGPVGPAAQRDRGRP